MSPWTESEIIDFITQTFPQRDEIAPRGIGDDCAIVREGQTLLTTDASVEGVHFNLNWMTLADAAYRCMASNVSDTAAMGAFAGAFSLALGIPRDTTFSDICDAVLAIKQCIQDHGLPDCWLIGGDVVRSPNAFFSITVLGKRPEWPVVMRSGAQPGDCIFVLGTPGFAAAGLEICMQNRFNTTNEDERRLFAPFLNAFRRPRALTGLGPALARNGLASAMMDLSDGIRTDLPRLVKQSHCGAAVDFSSLSAPRELTAAAALLNCDPMDWMTSGGEDFGLLMTCSPFHAKEVSRLAQDFGIPCTLIGKCTSEAGVSWLENGCASQRTDHSFKHFS